MPTGKDLNYLGSNAIFCTGVGFFSKEPIIGVIFLGIGLGWRLVQYLRLVYKEPNFSFANFTWLSAYVVLGALIVVPDRPPAQIEIGAVALFLIWYFIDLKLIIKQNEIDPSMQLFFWLAMAISLTLFGPSGSAIIPWLGAVMWIGEIFGDSPGHSVYDQPSVIRYL